MKIRTTIRGPEVTKTIGGLRALATAKDQLKRSKDHDPERERTYDWSRQLGRFTAKKDEIQKSVPSFARGETGFLFTRSGEKLNSGKQNDLMEVINSVEQETKVQRKKNDALRLVKGKLTNIKKERKDRKGKSLVENFLITDISNLNEGLYQ